ncbi:MAG: methylated-DNA--[protein]-cysteine S-methyltransferase [Bacilli bacterium]
MMTTITFKTPLGAMYAVEKGGAITEIGLGEKKDASPPAPVLLTARRQLEEYFAGNRQTFELPIALSGTAFQVAVWECLLKIPYGKTATYGEIAESLGKKKATRAVGAACGANPLMIVVPCHRVIGKNGRLTGYAGGLAVKDALLRLEKPAR